MNETPLMVVDPACGMAIEKKKAFASSSHKGAIYYFCSEKCKQEFVKDPETILAMMGEREKSIEVERSMSLEKMMDQVAHEIRNPLTSIGGFTRRMYERLPDDDPNREDMKLIMEDVARLERMIKQLVELKVTGLPRIEPSNVNDIIEYALKSLDMELKSANIRIQTELMDNPPTISVDKNKLTAAIGNLVMNAIESMQKEPRVLSILSKIKNNNEYLEIVVSDTGTGIPADKIKYIFDPFFTSKIYGPGLGLTFTQKIIQQHGGTISVESELDRGTTFTIRFPLKAR